MGVHRNCVRRNRRLPFRHNGRSLSPACAVAIGGSTAQVYAVMVRALGGPRSMSGCILDAAQEINGNKQRLLRLCAETLVGRMHRAISARCIRLFRFPSSCPATARSQPARRLLLCCLVQALLWPTLCVNAPACNCVMKLPKSSAIAGCRSAYTTDACR
jgi:hypothetical protein